MEENLLNQVIEFYKEKQWQDILNLNRNSDDPKASKICWVWPSQADLRYLKSVLEKHCVKGVISIGCGCGLLEWIIQESTGYPVIGYEINKEWWESRYSNPAFIPLNFVDNEKGPEFNSSYALLFCYFNNGTAFRNYVKKYRGNMILIIGPDDGSGRHTDPQPFLTEFGDSSWQLIQHREIKNTKDFIAIYRRKKANH